VREGHHQFLIMWDCQGLEYVGDITAAEQDIMWAALKDEHPTVTIPNIMHLKLRAQANPQRHYEIYFVDAEEGITADDIRAMFEEAPQASADIIREKGHCFFSNRFKQENAKIV
jgi:hypothetical protein